MYFLKKKNTLKLKQFLPHLQKGPTNRKKLDGLHAIHGHQLSNHKSFSSSP